MRSTLLPILLLCAALASVGVGVGTAGKRSRTTLVEQFAGDRQTQLDEAAGGVTDRWRTWARTCASPGS